MLDLPDGCQWDLEYQEQNFEGMLREVLGHHFQVTLWQRARACDDGEAPDISEVRALLRKGKKASDYRSLYWIDAIVQGAADTLFSRLAVLDEGLVKCACCGAFLERGRLGASCYFYRATLEDPSWRTSR